MIMIKTVISAIVEMGVEGSWEKIKRQDVVIKVLDKIGLKPNAPPPDFDGVYAYALVEYGVGRPKQVLDFFRHDFIKDAFRVAFEKRDPTVLDKEAENLLDWSDIGENFKQMDFDPRREFARFTSVFHTLADHTRTVAEVKRDHKLEDLHEEVQVLVARLESIDELSKLRTEIQHLLQVQELQRSAPAHEAQLQLLIGPCTESTLIEFELSKQFSLARDTSPIPGWMKKYVGRGGNMTHPHITLSLYLENLTSKPGGSVHLDLRILATPEPEACRFEHSTYRGGVQTPPIEKDPVSGCFTARIQFNANLVVYPTPEWVGNLIVFWDSKLSGERLPRSIEFDYEVYTLDGKSHSRIERSIDWP